MNKENPWSTDTTEVFFTIAVFFFFSLLIDLSLPLDGDPENPILALSVKGHLQLNRVLA